MNPRPWWKIVDWRIVFAVGVPFWLSVAGGVYLATEKPPVERPPYCPPPPLIETPVDPPLWSCPPYFPPDIEQAPSPRPVREVVTAPRDVKSEASVFAMVKLLADTIKGFQVQPVVEAKPELIAIPEGCKLHGTTLHLVKSPVEAFKLAPKQDKLVFVLHLAGNIEDDGFT